MSTKLFDLTGKVAIVTGAASGIPKAISLAFSEAGAHVALVDIDLAGLGHVSKEISERGGKAVAVGADVADAIAGLPVAFRADDRRIASHLRALPSGAAPGERPPFGPRLERMLARLDAVLANEPFRSPDLQALLAKVAK